MNNQTRKKTGKLLLIAQIPMLLFSVFIYSQIRTAFGDETEQIVQNNSRQDGLNFDIPKPAETVAQDKLSLIRQVQKDSIKEAKKLSSSLYDDFGIPMDETQRDDQELDANINKLQSKLNNVGKILEQKEREQRMAQNSQRSSTRYGNKYSMNDFNQQSQNPEMQKLDALVNSLDNTNIEGEATGELKDVNQTMDKLVKVMEMARAIETGQPLSSELEKQKKALEKEANLLTVRKADDKFNDDNSSAFFELVEPNANMNIDNTFKASFFNKQTLISGSTVKIKLDEPININNIIVPKNSFVYGKAVITKDRLEIQINSIRYKDYLFPVKLRVYDYDGLSGIHIPGSIERKLAKQEASRSISGMDFTTFALDQDLKDRAIQSGTNLAKDIFSRKVKVVKVSVQPYHKILLKNN